MGTLTAINQVYVNEAAVKALTDMLQMAKEGKLQSLAISATLTNGEMLTSRGYGQIDEPFKLLGGLEYLKSIIIQDIE